LPIFRFLPKAINSIWTCRARPRVENKRVEKMKRQTKPRRDDAEQSRLFIKKAREIEANEEKSAADDLLGHLAKKPPEPKRKT
jgi:hypothetical protein